MLIYSMKWETNSTQQPKAPNWESVPSTMCGWVSAPSQEALARSIKDVQSKYGNVILSDMEVKSL
jgi:hypothetical protein